MDEIFIFGNFVNIWDTDKNERVRANIGMCKDPLVVSIYGPYRVDN
jgi:hypothetical protein